MKITILDSIVYELLLSLSLYKRQTHLNYLTISKDWYTTTKEKISLDLHNQIVELENLQFEDLSVHLIEQCPYKDIKGYCLWLSELSTGDLYELLAPYLSEKRVLPSNLEHRRQTHISLLSKWNEEYFKGIEGNVAPILASSILKVSQTDFTKDAYDEVEKLTKGFSIKELNVTEVVLVPTWHFRPLSLIDLFNHKIILTFPCPLSINEETLLITKALGEEKRLQILSNTRTEAKSFTDLVKILNMSKGNIHHHLLILRSAGLLEIIPTREDYFLYKYRSDRIDDLSALLLQYE
ncbi:ArsR family transcriptional regulator [Brevibacillus ginsengisoli]|uniref:ArsR family transcriptional regulator n=1 Tax=Brevibacillus ginsengisoli TaxID=363854 RepID=UPI003CF335E8